MSINQPPGHYRDEQGREYYWDGERRHYLPDTSFRDFMESMNYVALYTIGLLIAVVIAIPIIALLIYGIYLFKDILGPIGNTLAVILVIYWLWRIRKSRRNR